MIGRDGQAGGSAKSTRSTYPEIAANAALVLIAVACSLLDRQLAVQTEIFKKRADSPNFSIKGAFRHGGIDHLFSPETTLEQTVLDWFEFLGRQTAFGLDISGMAREAVKQYSVEVESILKAQSGDPRQIERCLDGMLDFCFYCEMIRLYKKLCCYYFHIDPEATVYYVNLYRKMWDEEEPDEGQPDD